MSEEQIIIVDENDNEIGIYPRKNMRKHKKIHRGTYIYLCDQNCKLFIKIILLYKKDLHKRLGAQVIGINFF